MCNFHHGSNVFERGDVQEPTTSSSNTPRQQFPDSRTVFQIQLACEKIPLRRNRAGSTKHSSTRASTKKPSRPPRERTTTIRKKHPVDSKPGNAFCLYVVRTSERRERPTWHPFCRFGWLVMVSRDEVEREEKEKKKRAAHKVVLLNCGQTGCSEKKEWTTQPMGGQPTKEKYVVGSRALSRLALKRIFFCRAPPLARQPVHRKPPKIGGS